MSWKGTLGELGLLQSDRGASGLHASHGRINTDYASNCNSSFNKFFFVF